MRNEDLFSNIESKGLIEAAYSKKVLGRKYWNYIVELHKRASITEFELARSLANSPDRLFREIGADILGQIGYVKKKFFKRSVQILISMLNDEDYNVIAASATALGHRRAIEAVPYLVKLRKHKRQKVRFAVTFGLLGLELPEAIEALISLSGDPSKEVRNWATFGLGSMIESDTDEIRVALQKRLSDKNLEVYGEALLGLAKRRVPNIVSLVKRALSQKETINLFLEAAEVLADEQLLPFLQRIEASLKPNDDPYYISCLRSAINACHSKP